VASHEEGEDAARRRAFSGSSVSPSPAATIAIERRRRCGQDEWRVKDDEDDEDDGEDDDQHRAAERPTRAEGGAEVQAARVEVAMPRRARGRDADDAMHAPAPWITRAGDE
jgi:hypothetical protein